MNIFQTSLKIKGTIDTKRIIHGIKSLNKENVLIKYCQSGLTRDDHSVWN